MAIRFAQVMFEVTPEERLRAFPIIPGLSCILLGTLHDSFYIRSFESKVEGSHEQTEEK
jgi:hypothetical protein